MRKKLEKFFTSPEYESIIEFHSILIQNIDAVSNDYIFSNETTSKIRRLYSSEFERIDFHTNRLPEFKANAQSIKKIVENKFITEIINTLGIQIGFFNTNITDKIMEYIKKRANNSTEIKSLDDFQNITFKNLSIIKSYFDTLLKDNKISSFINKNFVR